MFDIGKNFKSRYSAKKVGYGETLNAIPITIKQDLKKEKVQKFLSLLDTVVPHSKDANSKDAKSDSWEYMGALGETSYSYGEAGSIVSHLAGIGSSASEGLLGVGFGLRAGLDLGSAYSRSKNVLNRNKLEKNFDNTFGENSLTLKNIFRKHKFNFDFVTIGLEDEKGNKFAEKTAQEIYEKLIGNICSLENIPKKQLIKKMNLAINLREYLNNLHIRSIGIQYGFVEIKSKPNKPNVEIFNLIEEKIPDAIKKMKVELEQIKVSPSNLSSNNLSRTKDLEQTIRKLQLLEIYEGLKKINKIRNNKDVSYAVIDVFKTIGDVVGFSGAVGSLVLPLSAPVTVPLLAAGISTRAAASLAHFIKRKCDLKHQENLHSKGNDINQKIINKNSELMAQLCDPIIVAKFPETIKTFIEAFNETQLGNNFPSSEQEKIIGKFEEKINSRVYLNNALKEEWKELKDDWADAKKQMELSWDNVSLRTFCSKYVEHTSEFILNNITGIKDIENSKTVDEVVDSIIEIKVLSKILHSAGLKENEINNSTFVHNAIKAYKEAAESRHIVSCEAVSNLNITSFLDSYNSNMKKLTSSGSSNINATMSLSNEFQKLIYDEISKAQKKAEQNPGSEQLAVYKDRLSSAMMSLI